MDRKIRKQQFDKKTRTLDGNSIKNSQASVSRTIQLRRVNSAGSIDQIVSERKEFPKEYIGSNNPIQCMRDKLPASTIINTLTELNNALIKVQPPISGISIDMFDCPGANYNIVNAAIKACNYQLWDGIKRNDILVHLRPFINTQINTMAVVCVYDTHGDKHFLGGPAGTKFTAPKADVNPQLEAYIQAVKGRIRRYAKGRDVTLYYTKEGIYCPANYDDLTIQIAYTAHDDSISYHGYPDNVTVYSLSSTKGGEGIP